MTKNYLFLSSLIALSLSNYSYSNDQDTLCSSKKSCQDLNNNCQCYCSGICSPRDKTDMDTPLWIENDKDGHQCYCKPWDRQVYEYRGCHIKEAQKDHAHELTLDELVDLLDDEKSDIY